MKKITLFATLIISIAMFTGCKTTSVSDVSPVDENVSETENIAEISDGELAEDSGEEQELIEEDYGLKIKYKKYSSITGYAEMEGEWVFDDNGNLLRESGVDENGLEFSAENEFENNVIKKSTSIYRGDTVTLEYNENGDLINLNHYTYDENGNLLWSYNVEYDSNGNIIKEIEDGVTTYNVEYDSNGNIIKEIDDGVTNKYEYSYDGNGNISQMIKKIYTGGEKNGEEEYLYEYDSAGNLKKETMNSTEDEITKFYDGNGHMIKEIEDLNWGSIKNTFEYDINGNLISIESIYWTDNADELNTLNKYARFDPNYETWQVTEKCSWDYDDNGNLTKYIENGTVKEEYEYDNGNLTKYIENGTVKEEYEYDSENRLLKKYYDGTLKEEYEYDSIGNLIKRAVHQSPSLTTFYEIEYITEDEKVIDEDLLIKYISDDYIFMSDLLY